MTLYILSKSFEWVYTMKGPYKKKNDYKNQFFYIFSIRAYMIDVFF